MRDTQFKRRAWQIGWKKTCMFPRDPFLYIIYTVYIEYICVRPDFTEGWGSLVEKKTCMFPRDPFVYLLEVPL